MNQRRIKKAIKRIKNLPKGKYLFSYLSNKAKQSYLKKTKSTTVAYPSTIMLELSNFCNLACTTCPREYAYGEAMGKGNMNMESAKRVIDELWPYLDSVGLTGLGETFIFKRIEEVIDYIKAKNSGIIISVSTNAVLPKFIEQVTPLMGKLDTIQVSIDGLGEIYNSIRVNAKFEMLDKNIRTLGELIKGTDTDLMLNMVVTIENYEHMPLLVDYAKEVGVKYLEFSLFNLVAVTNIHRSYYDFYSSKEFLTVVDELEKRIKATPEVIVSDRNFKIEDSFQKCIFPWSHYYVSWNGYVPPCCAKPFPKELHFGNVNDEKVIDVLNSDSYKEFRTQWLNDITPDFCKKCNLVDGKEPFQDVKELPVVVNK